MMDMTAPASATETVQRLFLQHAAALRGFLLGLLADRDAANDVFQELFLTVTRNAGQFRPDGSFLAWARGIARNKVLEHYRKCRQLPRLFDDQMLEVLAASAGQHDDHWEERRAALAACIQQLAPRARQILELRYADRPLAPPEIAERLSWTVNAVHVALARARKFLQECTRRRLAGGEA
jgi:RNA polymerase sigma-70 factor (ECF subfamily)